MNTAGDARFWDRTAVQYARDPVADPGGYERTLGRTRALLGSGDRVLEIGCGTGTTALRLADGVGDYLATDISAGMIAIAREKHAAAPVPNLAFRTAALDQIEAVGSFDAVLAFSCLHLVRDLPGTLGQIRAALAADGLFVSKTPCIGDMNPLIRLALPAMRAIGKAPYAAVFRATDLRRRISDAGFEILAMERHATKGDDRRAFIAARKRGA